MNTLGQTDICEYCFRREADEHTRTPFGAPLCSTCNSLGHTRGDEVVGAQRID